MNHRERFLAVLEGRSPDRIPWYPRLEIWYEAHRRLGTLPEKYQGWSLRDIERDLGVGSPARESEVFRSEIRDVEICTHKQGYETTTEYHTPLGTVTTLLRDSEDLQRVGIRGQEVEHLIKRPEDYAVVEYLIEHTQIIPTYEAYLAYETEVGDAGYPLMHMGQDPMDRILQELIGYNAAYYHLQDYPDRVAHLQEVLEDQAAKIQQIVLDSPARLILYGYHFDSQMTPASLFRKHMLPHFRAFADRLHARGKYLACHADADSTLLLDLIKQAGFDMVDCFVTAPMAPVTLAQARRVWGKDVIIYGGIPSIMLCDPVGEDEFEDHLRQLFRDVVPGDAFMLGVADNVMPEAKLERLVRVSEMVEQHGYYPLGGR